MRDPERPGDPPTHGSHPDPTGHHPRPDPPGGAPRPHIRRRWGHLGGSGLRVCERCGANEHVHRGLCRACRKTLTGSGEVLAPENREEPTQAPRIPLHRPPWRRRGA